VAYGKGEQMIKPFYYEALRKKLYQKDVFVLGMVFGVCIGVIGMILGG